MANNDIILSAGTIYTAAIGTALPAQTVAYGADWVTPAGWSKLGKAAAAVKTTFKGTEINLEYNEDGIVDVRPGPDESVELSFELADFNLANLAKIMRGTTTNTAAATGVPGYTTINAGGNPSVPQYTVGIEFKHLLVDGTAVPCRIQIHLARFQFETELNLDAKNQTKIPVKIMGFKDVSKSAGQQLLTGYEVTAAAL